MELIFNPILLSVIVLMVLCLLKLNVILSLIVATLTVGVLAGMPIGDIMGTFLNGMAGNAEAALSYVLLGAIAIAMEKIGLTDMLSSNLSKVIKEGKLKLVIMLIIMGALSQTIMPVHIAFIPIIIPALLGIMNKIKCDRRLIACTLAFGMKTTYVTIPVGYGMIFHNIIANNMTNHGMAVQAGDVWKSVWILGIGMTVGLVLAYLEYRKPREYEDVSLSSTRAKSEDAESINETTKLNKKHYIAIVGTLCTLAIQLKTESMVLGAFVGLMVFVIFGVIPWKKMDDVIGEGVAMMGFMSFVMLCATGFGEVISTSGAIEPLINEAIATFGTNKIIVSIVMLILGLFITIGTGTSFGTVPILSAIYVPFALQLGFSIPATIVLIAGAATIGDAGSPASDMTLGPTSGLNADGQHDHIYDSTVPTIKYFVTASFIFSLIGALTF